MTTKPYYCGFCLGAPLCADGTDLAHCRCRLAQCACAQGDHALTPELVGVMAAYCGMTEVAVIHYHENQRESCQSASMSSPVMPIL